MADACPIQGRVLDLAFQTGLGAVGILGKDGSVTEHLIPDGRGVNGGRGVFFEGDDDGWDNLVPPFFFCGHFLFGSLIYWAKLEGDANGDLGRRDVLLNCLNGSLLKFANLAGG